MRVLLVEDEPTLAQSIELMLRSENFEVATAALGEEAFVSAATASCAIAKQSHAASQIGRRNIPLALLENRKQVVTLLNGPSTSAAFLVPIIANIVESTP